MIQTAQDGILYRSRSILDNLTEHTRSNVDPVCKPFFKKGLYTEIQSVFLGSLSLRGPKKNQEKDQ